MEAEHTTSKPIQITTKKDEPTIYQQVPYAVFNISNKKFIETVAIPLEIDGEKDSVYKKFREWNEDPNNEVHEWIDGFAIQQNPIELTPTQPTTEKIVEESGALPLFFKSTPLLGGGIPQVKEQDTSTVQTAATAVAPYTYKVWRYFPVRAEEEWPLGMSKEQTPPSLDKEGFVFIKPDTRANDKIPQGIYVRYKDLSDRLASRNPEKRLELYARDWHLACAGFSPSYLQQVLGSDYGPLILAGKANPKYPDPKKCEQIATELNDELRNCTYSHFPMWDEHGNLFTPAQTAKMLANLLKPKSLVSTRGHFASDIFKQYCDLAYFAAIENNAPWTVFARFWSRPVPNREVVLCYSFPDAVVTKLGATLNQEEAHFCIGIWKDMIKEAHESALVALSKRNGPLRNFIPSPKFFWYEELGAFDKPEYVLLGSHPQNLYQVWIKQQDKNQMQYFNADAFPLPTSDNVVKAVKIGEAIALPAPAVTHTWIGAEGVQDAKGRKRPGTQNAVMESKGASEFVKTLLGNVNLPKRTAEWLHRSAHSFGPLCHENGTPMGFDSPQSKWNLVWGTYDANTHMIRYENYLKRLAQMKLCETPYRVELKTELDYQKVPFLERLRWPGWIAPELKYTWRLRDPENPDFDGRNGQVVFDLFSRFCPTRFEAMLDEFAHKYLKNLISPDMEEEEEDLDDDVKEVAETIGHRKDFELQDDAEGTIAIDKDLAEKRPDKEVKTSAARALMFAALRA